jgi:hypothetical protein
MRGEWTDPTDTMPNAARTARTVTGFRSFGPLRQCLKRHGDKSTIKVEHIFAADMLRRLADAVCIGLSGSKNRFNTDFIEFAIQPRQGPQRHELQQARAWKPFQRAMKLFDEGKRKLVTAIVLLNTSTLKWCEQVYQETGKRPLPQTEQQRLVVCLDRLVEHFRGEIDKDIKRGQLAA